MMEVMSETSDQGHVAVTKKREEQQQKLPSDSVLVYIPLEVTADLGVAFRRVREKRLLKFKTLCPTLFPQSSLVSSSQKQQQYYEESKQNNENNNNLEKDEIMDLDDADNESLNDDIDIKNTQNPIETQQQLKNKINNVPQRDQYANVLEYLEAKYVKGVQIDDYDERIREKKRQQQKKKKMQSMDNATTTTTTNDTNDNDSGASIMSDSVAGSIYSDDSGNFIDDSELKSEVVQQIMSSSMYGTTKIEAEAAANRKLKKKDNDDDDFDMMDGDDDAFFVNIGDLEMDDGWIEDEDFDDHDWMGAFSKEKRRKRKRSTNSKETSATVKDPSKSKTTTKELNTKQDKTTKIKSKPKSESKDNTEGDTSRHSTSKSDTTSSKLSSPKKKKAKNQPSSTTPSSSKVDDKPSSSKDSSTKKKDKEATKKPKSETKMVVDVKDDETTASPEIIAAKKDAEEKKQAYQSLFKKCIREIKKMNTEEHLPRKSKKGEMVHVSVTIPASKKGGDMITFSNPHVPAQKLKVKIPDDSKPGDSFKVSVPTPNTKKTSNEPNKFTKSCTAALDKYSSAYDDWCSVEAKYQSLVQDKPASKLDFKPGVERLKKFDKMLKFFPNDLQNPIDASFLRALVRRQRQNEHKKMKSSLGASVDSTTTEIATTTETPKEQLSKVLELNIPGLGAQFPSIVFKESDFNASKNT